MYAYSSMYNHDPKYIIHSQTDIHTRIYVYGSTRKGKTPSGTLSQHLSHQQETVKQGTTQNEPELSESMYL